MHKIGLKCHKDVQIGRKNMSRTIIKIALVSILLLAASSVLAQGPNNRPFGLGLSLGEPAGINGKYWFNKKNALDVALGYGYFPYNGAAVYIDYLINMYKFNLGQKTNFDLLFYMGGGFKLGVWRYKENRTDHDGLSLGIRVPLGITMVFKRHPFDIFFELTPALAFIDPHPLWFDLDACIGGRFYF
jgi:hypothetical protein